MLFAWLPLEAKGAGIGSFWALALVLTLAVAVPLLFSRLRRWRIPVVVGEILAGMVVGRSGLGWVQPDEPMLRLLAEIGFVFLMFLAGMELDLRALRAPAARGQAENGPRFNPLTLAVAHYTLTVVMALGVGWALARMGWVRIPTLMALILSTTSMDVAMLVLKERGLIGGRYGQTLLLTAIIADFVSMLLITVHVAVLSKGLTPEILLVGLLFVAVFAFYRLGIWALPGLRPLLDELSHATTHIKVRVAFWLFVAFVALAEVLGVEVILGAFLAGMLVALLSGPEDVETRHQLESVGYGFFVPIFFIMVGAKFNLAAFAGQGGRAWLLVPLLLLAAVGIKVLPAVVFRRAFSWRESLAGGALLSARLSLIIAAAEIGQRLGAFDEAVVAAIVLVAVVTVVAAPWVFNRLVREAPQPLAARPIVVVGGGHLGVHLATLVREHQQPVVVLDDDPQRVARAREQGLEAHLARPYQEAAAPWLEQAQAAVITRSDPDLALQWARWLRGHFGIEPVLVLTPEVTIRTALAEDPAVLVITPLEAQATFLALMARNPDFMRLLVSAHDQRDVHAVTLRNPAYHGRRIRDLDWPAEVLILTVQREGEYLVPHGNTRLQLGDLITLLGAPEVLAEVERRLQQPVT